MKKLFPSGLLNKGLKQTIAALAFAAVPLLAFAQEAADVIEPPKEFDPVGWDWMFIASVVLTILVLLVIIRTFDIGSLTETITGKKVIKWDKVNGLVGIIFLVAAVIGVAYEMVYHGKYVLLGNASSAHGKALDSMFMWTFVTTFIVFCITEILLFYFMFRYSYNENRKAHYFFHNNKLELIWTVVPAIVLTFLVLRGFNTWSRITDVSKLDKNTETIEVFAYQFGWKARYNGEDKQFGESSFTFISGKNPLGLAVNGYVDSLSAELNADLKSISTLIGSVEDSTIAWNKELQDLESKQNTTAYPAIYKDIKQKANDASSGAYLTKLERDKRRKTLNLQRIASYRKNKEYFNNSANDDKITTEIVIVKNRSYLFKFRARDVIHSAWMPEFRAQMNVVPGMGTHFAFIPVKTTEEARKEKNDSAFDYYLYCNKICGAAHYNMKIKITVVETMADFNTWIAAQAPVVALPMPVSPGGEMKKSDSAAAIKPTVASK